MIATPKLIDRNTAGIYYGITAYIVWGILPLYWKLLKAIPPLEILFHRIIWSFIFMALIVLVTRRWKTITGVFSNRKKLFLMFACGFIISLNWFTYIYAVNTDHVIEASMGYYINPLVIVLLGVTILKEKLSRWQLVAILLAAVGVVTITVQYGRIPWIALFLAFSFALYGLIKKMAAVESVAGLVLETLIVVPIALFFLISLERSGSGALGTFPLLTKMILAGAGVATAIPLLLFARGVERTTFSMIGFLQYIAPTLTLLLGVFVFKEHFSTVHLISFCLIWAALIIFTLSNLRILKEPVVDQIDHTDFPAGL